jgi:hypothetical protein
MTAILTVLAVAPPAFATASTDSTGSAAISRASLVPPASSVRPAEGRLVAFSGYGAWVDRFDWAPSWSKRPKVTVLTIDAMARVGVQTLYIQTGVASSRADLIDPAVLRRLILRAKLRGLKVVAWYLPRLTDQGRDLRHLLAAARLPGVDGIGVDIETSTPRSATLRGRRILALSRTLRARVPQRLAIAAIPYPPVQLAARHSAWPYFPWKPLRPYYDVWMPMAYWSYRSKASGMRDGYRYTKANLVRLRQLLGPGEPIHPIGSPSRVADILGMQQAMREEGAIGGSVYDWVSTPSAARFASRGFRTMVDPLS